MAEQKKRFPWARAPYLALFAVFYGSYWIGCFGNDGSSFVTMAATSVSGIVLGPAALFATVLAVRRHWADLGVCLSLTLAYFVVTGQFVWRPQASLPDDIPELRVLTFNIEHGRHGPEKVADVVRSQNIDAFAFQECSGTSDLATTVELERLLPEYRFVSDGSRTSGTRLPLILQRVHKLTPYDYSWTMIEQVVAFHGKRVRILNVHAPSYLPDATLRRPAVEWFKRWGELSREQHGLIDEELKVVGRSDLPTVLCGDFNMTPGCGRYERMARRATDVFATVGRGTGWTSPAGFPVRRIDFVWTFPGLVPLDCYVVDRRASDHAAVVAALAVR